MFNVYLSVDVSHSCFVINVINISMAKNNLKLTSCTIVKQPKKYKYITVDLCV